MNRNNRRKVIGVVLVAVVIAGLAVVVAGASPLDPATPPPPQGGAKVSEPQFAPLRPGSLDELPPGTGYRPPQMDLSHLNGQKLQGVSAPQAPPSSWDWRTQGKVTAVKNQSTCGACYAFAALGDFESQLLTDSAGTFDLSENNAKECNWREINNTPAGWGGCGGGNYYMLASLFSQKGTVLEADDPYSTSDSGPCNGSCSYQQTLLDWRIISGNAVPPTGVLKQYIYDNGPVYTTLYAGHNDAWQTEFGYYDGTYVLSYSGTETPNHAVLITGWDDDLLGSGSGGWIVKNSWGTGWGDSGYFYIAYGSASIGMDSSFVYDWQDYDANGGVWYYDDDTWGNDSGYPPTTTAWGLAKFTPDRDTSVTRVELWTTAVSTTVDVYLYDSFDGTTLGTKLGEVLGTTYNEAGYHSVELGSPVAVSNGDDVVAVVKFANHTGYTYPVPIDWYGPSEYGNGRTYTSPSGNAGTWNESTYDVAIRLRWSNGLDVAISKQLVGRGHEPGDPVTFTLAIENKGLDLATNVIVTDALSSDILTPTCDSSLSITERGVVSYSWDLPDLTGGESGVITIYGTISPTMPITGMAIWNTAIVSSDGDDSNIANNTSTALIGGERVYLPLVMRNH